MDRRRQLRSVMLLVGDPIRRRLERKETPLDPFSFPQTSSSFSVLSICFISMFNSKGFIYLIRNFNFFSGCGGRKLKDRCRISISVASVNECPNLLFAPLAYSKNVLPRFELLSFVCGTCRVGLG